MENLGLVNIEQSTSSADTDLRNAHNSVGCNQSHCSFSGKTGPAIIPGIVDRLASFRQDVPRNGDSELLMNCETRWLQLFRRVEEQCQEQIVAQQKQFYHQIHRIQNEIRHLVKLQNQNVCLCTKQGSLVQHIPIFPSSDSPMGLQSEHELSVSQHTSNDTKGCLQASPDIQVQGARGTLGGTHPSGAAVHQECLTNSVSLSSGYGTSSAAELSPGKSKDVHVFMENSQDLTKGQDGALSVQVDLIPAKRDSARTTVEHGPSLKAGGDAVFPAESEHKVNEGQCGKTKSKSLTSWAQKVKKSQLKRTPVEEVATQAVQGQEQTQKLAFEDANPIAAEPPSYTFCPSRPKGSQNSIASDNSGLTYWKLDEQELYRSLPEKFSNEFSIASTKMSSEQSSSCDEMKPSSLKDIYHKKQQENRHLIDWNLSPSQSTHPPEILTLDPTLHMRPSQQNRRPPSHGFYGTPEKVCFSPDSMMEPTFSTHLDTDSFSRASSMYSPPSVGSPNDILSTTALHVDSWNSCGFQNNTNPLRSSPVAYAHSGNEVLNTEEEDNLTLTPSSAAQCQPLSADNIFPEYNISPACVEDPAVLSRIRQNLREKHARHVADLRAYYDSEIQSLKQQLEASHKPPSKDLKKINQTLADRCDQLETTLNDANNRLRTLENKNNTLEMEVTNWKERFCTVSNTTKALQERIEEMRTSGKEKDNTISRLKRRVKELEEEFEKAYKLSDNKDARLKEENKMFQNLLGEYESLGKEHERVKDTLNITENKLLDAHAQISDLKRTVSKLEGQIKQLEHENGLKFRQLADNPFRTSYTHSILTSSDVSRRKWLIPGAEYSIFTGQPLEAPENPKDNRLRETYATCRFYTPPEKDCSSSPSQTNDTAKKEPEPPETPIIKAFKELEERKASKSRGVQAEKESEVEVAPAKATSRRPTVGFDETALGARQSPEKGKDHQRHKRYSSPNGQRASSVPPSNRKLNTPTRREIMIAPLEVTCSPKRSPKENLSPGFSHLLNRNKNTMTRFDILLDDLEVTPLPASPYSSPRKRLQFLSIGDTGGAKNGTRGPAGEDESSAQTDDLCLPSSGLAACEADFKYVARFKTLAEIEKLFDDLTQEKQQIESQLSRIPSSGGRMSLQARLNQEALEDHLERINRELGSVRMVLKKFLILRTSANI